MAHSLISFARDFLVDPAAAAQKWSSPVLVWEAVPQVEKVITQVQFPGQAEAGSETVLFEVKKTSRSALVAKMPEVRVGSGGGNDVVVPDPSIAASHAFLQGEGGQWALGVTDAAHEAQVDGAKVAPGAPLPLRDRSRVRLGAVELLFLLPGSFADYLKEKSQR